MSRTLLPAAELEGFTKVSDGYGVIGGVANPFIVTRGWFLFFFVIKKTDETMHMKHGIFVTGCFEYCFVQVL